MRNLTHLINSAVEKYINEYESDAYEDEDWDMMVMGSLDTVLNRLIAIQNNTEEINQMQATYEQVERMHNDLIDDREVE